MENLDWKQELHSAAFCYKASYVVLGFGALLRVTFFFFATNNGGDALARAAIMAAWLRHPSLAPELAGPNWLPIHFWMMAAIATLVHSATLGSRLLSLVFGIFSVWAVWRIALEEYGVRSALLSAVIFSFYTLHIGYSTTSSSEATYLGLVLAGMLCFFKHARADQPWLLVLSGVFFTVAAGVRYEAWVLIALLIGILLMRLVSGAARWQIALRDTIIFGTISSCWPILWMLSQWERHGDPLFAVHYNAHSIADQIAINTAHAGLYQLALPPGVIVLTLTPIAVCGAIYALFLAARKPKGRELAMLALGFAVIHFRSVFTSAILATARYTLTDGTLLCLLTGYGLYNFAKLISMRSYYVLFGATAIAMAINLIVITALSGGHGQFSDKFKSVSPLLQYPQRIDEIRQFLAPRFKRTDRVVVDNYNEDPNIIASAIGLPLLRGDLGFLASESNPSAVLRYMQTYRPQYVIMANQSGNLSQYLLLSPECPADVHLDGFDFTCIFRSEMYRIYSVSYAEPRPLKDEGVKALR